MRCTSCYAKVTHLFHRQFWKCIVIDLGAGISWNCSVICLLIYCVAESSAAEFCFVAQIALHSAIVCPLQDKCACHECISTWGSKWTCECVYASPANAPSMNTFLPLWFHQQYHRTRSRPSKEWAQLWCKADIPELCLPDCSEHQIQLRPSLGMYACRALLWQAGHSLLPGPPLVKCSG